MVVVTFIAQQLLSNIGFGRDERGQGGGHEACDQSARPTRGKVCKVGIFLRSWNIFEKLGIFLGGINILGESRNTFQKIAYKKYKCLQCLQLFKEQFLIRFVAEGTQTAHDDQPAIELESIAWTVGSRWWRSSW